MAKKTIASNKDLQPIDATTSYVRALEAPKELILQINKALKIQHIAGQWLIRQGKESSDFTGHKLTSIFGRKASMHLPYIREGFKGSETEYDWDEKVDGVTYYRRTQIQPMQNAKGEIYAVLSMSRDRTEQRNAEQQVIKAEERFRTIVSSMNDIVFVLDKQQRHVELYGRWFELYGINVEDLIGKTASEISKPEDGKLHRKYNRMALAGQSVAYEWEGEIPVKGKFYARNSISPLRNDKGEITGIVGIAHDITEIKKIEQELEESYRRTRNVLESISDGFVAFDTEWRITYINRQGEKVLGLPRNMLLGNILWELFPNSEELLVYQKCFEAVEKRSQVNFDYFDPIRKAWFEVHLYPTSDGLVAYFSDITDRINLEQRKDEFLSIASHELKTPLSTIKAFSFLLRKHNTELYQDRKFAHYVEKMDDQVRKLAKLIQDLLDVTKIYAGKLEYNYEEFDLYKLAREAVEDLRLSSKTHKIKLIAEQRPLVVADRYRVGQVLTNLLSNAIKYSPNAKRIFVTLRSDGENAHISVQDFGIGIPTKNHAQVFERYFRVEGKNRESFSGLGLGLYISAEIVARHHGKIWVESEEENGSTFHFTLPLKQPIDKRT
jgi:PAS domain S-box-containing protein